MFHNYIFYLSWIVIISEKITDDCIEENETIDIFESVKLPSNIENTYQGKELLVEVHAEAVQARNFDPSGQWNIEIEETIADSISSITLQMKNEPKIYTIQLL